MNRALLLPDGEDAVGLAWLVGPWPSQAPVGQAGPHPVGGFGYSRLKVEKCAELRVSGQKEGWLPNPGDLFPVVFLYLPQRGPWGAAHRRGTSRRPRGGPSGQPRRQRLRGLRRSPRAGPVLSPVRFAELLILRRGRDSSRSRVACFRGSGSVRASRWGRASAFQGRLLSF